jgi:hypothetical protein
MSSRDVVYTMDALPSETRKGRVYERKGVVTSIVTPNTIWKSAQNFGSVARAERALADWRAAGWSGAPSSPARVFARALEDAVDAGRAPHPRAVRPSPSAVDPSRITWLWIESLVPARSHVTGGVYHYDINEAFYSAVAQGLPSAFFPWQAGDDNWVGEVEIHGAGRDLPEPFEVQDRAYLTAADVRHWDLDVTVRRAWSYVDLDVDLSPVFERVSSLFGSWTAKRARQQSWGCFAQSTGSVTQTTFKDLEPQTSATLTDRWTCPEWAVIVTRRIMRQVDRALAGRQGVSCFVDSVLTREPLTGGLGDAAGQWRIEGTYPEGVYLHAPGLWDDRPVSTTFPSSQWKRHAGISENIRRSAADDIPGDEPMIPDTNLPF